MTWIDRTGAWGTVEELKAILEGLLDPLRRRTYSAAIKADEALEKNTGMSLWNG